MEEHMRQHVLRIADRIYSQCKAPAVTPKGILMRAFQRMDVTRTGDVTVQVQMLPECSLNVPLMFLQRALNAH
jgi:hypothetical protein